ncbi:MAG TPA: TetR/AcrR family transcriptional regulator [Acidimicrobiales bacterium]|nr:TetR/AcrR family transcriptional regulator [Acidimicrobiales bacterium]
MRRRGWAGSPPTDDQDAKDRIVEAASRCVDRLGSNAFSLSEVANELSISRPTVYRYFPSTDELLSAVGQFVMREFSDHMQAHLREITDPAEWVVEGIAIAVEWLPSRHHLTLLLTAGRSEPFAQGFTSPVAVDMTRHVFRLASIDWEAHGLAHDEVDELIHLMLRLIASMLVDPPTPPYTESELRRYLRRWIAPAVEKAAVS